MTGPEKEILDTWSINAGAWTRAIASAAIESRNLVTNAAILAAISGDKPVSLLDMGCGEGWLLRALATTAPHLELFGLDAIPELVATAAETPSLHVAVASYEAVLNGFACPRAAGFDVIVFNFSLFGDQLVSNLLHKLQDWLSPGGRILIQTLHPYTVIGQHRYESGWLPGSWSGIGEDFVQPAPWYFRTFEDWIRLFSHVGYDLSALLEPMHPKTGLPASAIFRLQLSVHE